MEYWVYIDAREPGGPAAYYHFRPDCLQLEGGAHLRRRLRGRSTDLRYRDATALLTEPELCYVMQVTRNEVPLRRPCAECRPAG